VPWPSLTEPIHVPLASVPLGPDGLPVQETSEVATRTAERQYRPTIIIWIEPDVTTESLLATLAAAYGPGAALRLPVTDACLHAALVTRAAVW
jgi:hypothetical protein